MANENRIIDVDEAVARMTPKLPVHIHKVYPQHDWEKTEKGEIDMWAYENGFHNGPSCKRCYECFCVYCEPNYDETECVVDKECCPTCGATVAKIFNKCCAKCGQALDWGGAKNEIDRCR